MKFRDLPIDRKVLYTNFMMIAIPVLLVVATMMGILIVIVSRAGSLTPTKILNAINQDVSNYQLQYMFDSLSEKIAKNNGPLSSNDEFVDLYTSLETMGFEIAVTGDASDATYITQGLSYAQIQSDAYKITGSTGNLPKPLFYRDANQMVYYNNVQTDTGNNADILVLNNNLNYRNNDYLVLDNIEWLAKNALIVIGCTIIVIIILTGVFLGKKLSESILKPIGKLQEATAQISNGNLNKPVDYHSQDELGQVCENFEEMRLRLKEAVITREAYEDGRKQLIAGMSHDLATPLTAIKGYARGVLDGIADTPEKKEHYVSMLYNSACKMEKLVSNLLLFTKLDMREEPFDLQPINLGDYLVDFCEEVRPRLKQEDMDIVFFNRCTGQSMVKIDVMQFGRVLLNLTENSIKYKKNGQDGKIAITLFQNEAGQLMVWFEDNGIGINGKDSEKVFKSFYRCETTGGYPIQGNGLGLAISKQIIESMGGSIQAEGSFEGGFRLNIIFPNLNGERK